MIVENLNHQSFITLKEMASNSTNFVNRRNKEREDLVDAVGAQICSVGLLIFEGPNVEKLREQVHEEVAWVWRSETSPGKHQIQLKALFICDVLLRAAFMKALHTPHCRYHPLQPCAGNVDQSLSYRCNSSAASLVSMTSCNMVVRMARITDDAEYDSGKTSGNVPRPQSYSGNDHAYNGLRTRKLVGDFDNLHQDGS
ncbi:unnamed protein product [Protopolystoma xenopodis]|uniref:Uncharacterized protein n=1 Tax=Protopolystoma xenopodis TaxID=117903 RepID=A0A448XAK2_9PLAT|nr:unnamed protein product [Protopolystoma xenopodis]